MGAKHPRSSGSKILAAACFCVLALIGTSSGQLIQNGGFETGTLAGWTASGDVIATASTGSAFEGSRFASFTFLNGHEHQTFSFSQQFNLQTATVLNLVFYAQRYDAKGGTDGVALMFTVRIDGVVLSTTLPPFSGTGVDPNGWARYDLTTPATLSSGAHMLVFEFARESSSSPFAPALALDAASVHAVPESSTWALLSIGALCLGFYRAVARDDFRRR